MNYHQNTETSDFNGTLCQMGTNTPPSPQSQRENGKLFYNKDEKAKMLSMTDRQKLGLAKLAELRASGELKTPQQRFLDAPRPLRAIRRFCYECNGYSSKHATFCENSNCALWLFRRGSGVIKSDELPIWRKSHTKHLQLAKELKNLNSDDIETNADDIETINENTGV